MHFVNGIGYNICNSINIHVLSYVQIYKNQILEVTATSHEYRILIKNYIIYVYIKCVYYLIPLSSIRQDIENYCYRYSPIINFIYKQNFFPDRLFEQVL